MKHPLFKYCTAHITIVFFYIMEYFKQNTLREIQEHEGGGRVEQDSG